MTSSARLAGLFLLGAAQAAAQQAGPAVPEALPPLLQQRVAGAVAERWSVAPEQVRLEWGLMTSRATLSANTAFRLLGRGEDGWFAVVFEPIAGRPLTVRLHAGLADTVSVATRAVPANVVLAEADLRHEIRVRWRSPQTDSGVRARAGDLTRRAVQAGDVLAPPVVAPAPLVSAGAPVRIEWRRGDVMIELQGTAVNAAALGEAVQVRVEGRTGQLRGAAIALNTVRVGA